MNDLDDLIGRLVDGQLAQEKRLAALERLETGGGGMLEPFLLLPELRAFWPFSSADENGDAHDLSGQERAVMNNNAATFGGDGLAPYAAMVAASTQYFSRADEAGLDITGGLTLGGWFYITANLSGVQGLAGKWIGNTNQRAYLLSNFNGSLLFSVSSSGAAATAGVTSAITPALNTWQFVAARFVPAATVDIWVNRTKTTDTTTVPASLFNSSAAFQVGRHVDTGGTARLLDGRASLGFLCAAAASDLVITNLYERSRRLFG